MAKKIRYVVIDPVKREVREEVREGDHLKNMQELVGGYIEIAAKVTRKSQLVVNEEGLLQNLTPWFYMDPKNGQAMRLVGPAVICGMSDRGDPSADISADEIRRRVGWGF